MKRERSDDYAGSLGRLSPAGLKHGPLVVGMDWDYKMALDLFTPPQPAPSYFVYNGLLKRPNSLTTVCLVDLNHILRHQRLSHHYIFI